MRTPLPLLMMLAKISRDFNNLDDRIQQRNPVWCDNFGNTTTEVAIAIFTSMSEEHLRQLITSNANAISALTNLANEVIPRMDEMQRQINNMLIDSIETKRHIDDTTAVLYLNCELFIM